MTHSQSPDAAGKQEPRPPSSLKSGHADSYTAGISVKKFASGEFLKSS